MPADSARRPPARRDANRSPEPAPADPGPRAVTGPAGSRVGFCPGARGGPCPNGNVASRGRSGQNDSRGRGLGKEPTDAPPARRTPEETEASPPENPSSYEKRGDVPLQRSGAAERARRRCRRRPGRGHAGPGAASTTRRAAPRSGPAPAGLAVLPRTVSPGAPAPGPGQRAARADPRRCPRRTT